MSPPLAPGEVHLWHLELGGTLPERARQCLDEGEWNRASQFRLERDRTRYAHAHCRLREVLGGYLGIPGAEIRFRVNAGGKPGLDVETDIGFNLSHSGDFGILAVGRFAQIGVDIEELAPRGDRLRLARSIFAPEEFRALAEVDAGDRTRAFLIGWTRKEAYLKALGIGLSVRPATVQAGIGAGRVRIPGLEDCGRPCADVETVPCDERCVAALAVCGGWSQVKHYHCPESASD